MKTVLKNSLKLACLALAVVCAHAAAAQAQQPAPSRVKLQMETLDRLAARAEKTVDVTVDESLLGLVKGIFANPKDEKAREVAQAIAGLQGVYVRVFEFAGEGQWAESDIADIRRQVTEPGWSRPINVTSRKDGRKVEVFVRAMAGKVGGLVVLATEPKALVVINMVGDVDVQKLAALQGPLGLPDLDINFGGDDDTDDKDKDAKRDAKPATKKP